jgi:dTDP-4-amino-4,6-dideoxygalactose transaminase
VGDGRNHVYHLYIVATDERDSLKKALADSEITTSLNYPKALPFYPAYAYLGHKPADFPAAYRNQSRILSLPIFPEMTDEMIEYVANQTKCALEGGSAAVTPKVATLAKV